MTNTMAPIVPPRLHKLKCLAPHFAAVLSGIKRCEVRLNDRNYQTRDFILLCEVLPRKESGTEPTGRELLVSITHILRGGEHGLDSQYVAMSIERTAEVPTR